MDTPEARGQWKAQLVAFLIPHLKGDEAERDSALNAVLTALDTAHAEGLRQAASLCRTVAAGAQEHGEAAGVLAAVIETMAAQVGAHTIGAAQRFVADMLMRTDEERCIEARTRPIAASA